MRLNKDLKQTDIFFTGTITGIDEKDGIRYAYIDLLTMYDHISSETGEVSSMYLQLHDELGYEVGDQVALVWANLNDSE